MANFIVLVLDGFGIGAQADVPKVRPEDWGSNTFKHLAENDPNLNLPTLSILGLANAAGFETENIKFSPNASFGKSELKHFGADTFWGHQEIMGTLPKKSIAEPIKNKVEEIKDALEAAGHEVRIIDGKVGRFLVVDNALTVADNIETDAGLAINVTASLDIMPFDKVVEIGKIVRSLVTVSRVITFGGENVSLTDILSAVEEKEDGYIGVNAPKSGVYLKNYQCVHLGYGVEPKVQIPGILHKAGIHSILIGKVADIVHNPISSNSLPMVPTAQVMQTLIEQVRNNKNAFICANVQETDLCGHREDPIAYINILKIVDKYLAELLKALGEDDILIVQADHGNDPTVGHSHHTREMVPLLIAGAVGQGVNLGMRASLSDVAATAADFFGVAKPQNGESFMSLLKQNEECTVENDLMNRISLMHVHEIINEKERDKIFQLLAYFKEEMNFVLTEDNSAPFVTHFAVLLGRLRRAETISAMVPDIYDSLMEEDNFELAMQTMNFIRSELAPFPNEEIGYIMAHLINVLDKLQE